ncbi:MAG TPA: hypothetical protein DHN33_00755, partial [Eubacteriaceae bacterium]|nr:hypothetical protein [Eubacteriaceae bacterium]
MHNERNRERALNVIQKMFELGHINEEEYEEAQEKLENNDFGLIGLEEQEMYSYFTDALYENLVDDLMQSEEFTFQTREEAQNYLLNSGLVIHSTIDPRVQEILDRNFKDDGLFPNQTQSARQASEALTEELGEEVNFTPEGAMVIIENETGHVAGIIGGRNKEGSRSLNRATRPFQIGSTTKPLTVYGPGLDSKKITLAKTYDDVPIAIGSWTPTNAGITDFAGMTSVREGLRRSKNVVTVQAWFDVGLQTSADYADKLGLDIIKEGDINDMNPAALSLGGYTRGQTALAMASAYSTFPNMGARNHPVMYTHIEDKDGKTIFEKEQEVTRVFSEQTAYLMTNVLMDVVRGGTTSISVPGTQIAGKTGTTDDQMHAWFAGYTKEYSAAVWYGYDENKVTANGRTYDLHIGIYGGSRPGPASMWQSVMREVHETMENSSLPGN